MNSEKTNEFGADDSSDRVPKIPEAAVLALKKLDQLRSADWYVLHIPGVGRIAAPTSVPFASRNRRRPKRNATRKIIVK
jgi:hypothetical protein